MKLLTTSEMAERWKISRRRVTTLCNKGRIEGAILRGNTWLIPNDAKNQRIQEESIIMDTKIDKIIIRIHVEMRKCV